MIIVRLLFPEPVGWLSTTNSTRVWEPTLSWNQLRSSTRILANKQRKLVRTPVGVEKVRDWNVFSAAMIAVAEFFALTSSKGQLPQ
jgi:hypothetical protein